MVEVLLNEEEKKKISNEVREIILNEISKIKDISNFNNKEWMKKKDACKYLSVSNNTFDRFRYEGLPSCTVSGITLYNRKDIDDFFINHRD
ncbi:hypothetical protein Q2T76_01820 [Lactobacillus sp. YT155]|uniref:hypothetical protein n=1 Tax=Lactobacillus sp. YT155 TaxID=3060955 RepID=UPI00265FB6D4|nr:hypothetical protein [Lactobacillus sp. YT155]MDO1604789.1 hypothetical protein [Lactobacillus sp. YT155]